MNKHKEISINLKQIEKELKLVDSFLFDPVKSVIQNDEELEYAERYRQRFDNMEGMARFVIALFESDEDNIKEEDKQIFEENKKAYRQFIETNEKRIKRMQAIILAYYDKKNKPKRIAKRIPFKNA